MYLLYSALLAAGLIVSLPYWLWQMARHGKYCGGLSQRLGGIPGKLQDHVARPVIWVHAVSVGEVLAVEGIVRAIRNHHPRYRVVISTTTDTGQKLARTHFGPEDVFYFPLDLTFAIRPYLRTLRPELIILAETEFWPNFLRLASKSGARILVVNARISDKSWPGYRRWRWVLRRVLRPIRAFLTQTEEDKKRLMDIGAASERVQVVGNLKFDGDKPPAPPIVTSLRRMFEETATGPVIVCGSTVEGEEPLLLSAFGNILVKHPRAAMILAPRHPERFGEVAHLLEKLGIRFWRRLLWSGESLAGGVLLVDSIGELAALYGMADIAFVGGSLVPRGGHNIIEPARHGVPIVVGNHTENFRDIVELFQSRDAIRVVGPAELPLVFMELLSDDEERRQLGHRAAEALLSQMGATQRTLDVLEGFLPENKQDQ
jgi:3-deoxy-D-manno-octulosonic-acid transferase